MAKRRKRNKNWLSWIVILLLLIGAVVVCVLVKDAYFSDKKEPEPTDQHEEPVKVVEPEKVEDKKEEIEEKEKVVQYDGTDPNNAGGITGVITYAGVSGSNLMIRVNIDQYLNGGNCTLKVLKGGSIVYNATAAVIDSASTSTCEGFNVPVSSLPSGNVDITISISSNGKTGEITGGASL